ncbi:MAG: septation regulator SpoVG [Clostridia bacterium]|nr:septation regulator SpoVG [Clostridia bacterium]
MQISDIRVRIIRKEGKLKAVASIIIDNAFAVHDIKIIENNNEYFVSMPSRKTQEGDFKDIAHPINSETRSMLSELILKEFFKKQAEE